jgi:hypothetical protein
LALRKNMAHPRGGMHEALVGAHDILLMPRDNAKLLSVCINLEEMQPATRFTELNGNTLVICLYVQGASTRSEHVRRKIHSLLMKT